MKPPIPDATRFLAGMLRDDIVPQLTGFRAGNAGMTAAMLDMVADVWDTAAARLHSENRELADLLGEAGGDDVGDLRISALTARNEALKARLIARHAEAEEEGDNALDEKMWAFLRRSVEAQRIASANF